jgi:transcriptional regulator with XRE-family HTH domain
VTADVTPTIARREVRLAVRDARERAGLTQPQVAQAMEWSLSKVIRVENGDVSIAPNDLRPLLRLLDVSDGQVVAELLSLAKIARTRQRTAWYHQPGFREHLTPASLRLVEYEAEAVEIRYHQVFYLPAPLQVPEYARANLESFDDGDIPAESRRVRVEARRRRRLSILARLGRGLDIYALLDESVLRRPVGGPAVFLTQLRDLHDLAAAGLIQIRMIPFGSAAALTNNATFDLLTLRPGGPGGRGEVLYRETGLLDEIVEDASVERHHRRFDKIWRSAADEVDTLDFMRSRITDLTTW